MKTNKYAPSSLVGRNVIDIMNYDQEVHDFLLSRGATPYTGYSPNYATNGYYENLSFSGQKPVKFQSYSDDHPSARIFFASNDDALIFSVVFGHKIFNSYVKEIKDLLDQRP
jgi:hypothetical protein